MTLLTVNNVKKSFGASLLFENVSFGVETADKIGLVGVNGAGKTTLFKIILGTVQSDGGDIYKSKDCKIGYMEQHGAINSQNTVYNELMTVFSCLSAIEHELEEISRAIDSGDASLIPRQQALSEEYERGGGFTFKSRVRGTLLGLGFSEEDFELSVSALSGGQRTRLMLGKILLSGADILLLDEPTNHLDIRSVEWLESFLRSYESAVIIISHDRYFLDRVIGKTFDMSGGKLTAYNGNYSEHLRQKEENDKYIQRTYDNTMREIKRIEGIIKQQKQWNRERNIKTAESKQKMIDRLEKDLTAPEQTESEIRFEFAADKVSGNDVLAVSGAAMSFGEKRLFKDVDMDIKRGDRAFLLGPNGCGKTTLLRMITGRLEGACGEIKTGANVNIGYYDQIQAELNTEKTALQEVWDAYPQMTQTDVRNALAAFLFKGDNVGKKISALSGGERARISLLKLMLSKSPFLVLDEPTNHLDIRSREALENAFFSYNGTTLIVSHDRYLINKLADRIMYLTEDGLKVYEGDYDYFLEKHREDTIAEAEKSEGKNDYKAKKELEATERKRRSALVKAEEEIDETEREINQLELLLAQPDVAVDYQKALEISERAHELKSKLNILYEKWSELHE